jgi:hypothetical protein
MKMVPGRRDTLRQCHEHGMDHPCPIDELAPALTQRVLEPPPSFDKETPMNKTVLISITLLALSGASAFAQSGPTPQEKMACRNDAQSLCAEHIGKPSEMNACLAANKARLSEPCRKVVEAHGG